MLKKLLLALSVLLFTAFAWAVDVNTASQAELEAIKGIGPKTAEAIIAERKKGGAFKSTQDMVDRVKGVGDTNVEKFKAAGLTVAGEKGAPAPAEVKKESKKENKKEAKEKVVKEEKPAAAKEEKKESKKESRKEAVKEDKAVAKKDAVKEEKPAAAKEDKKEEKKVSKKSKKDAKDDSKDDKKDDKKK